VEADIHVFAFSGIGNGGQGVWLVWKRETRAGQWWENLKAEATWMIYVEKGGYC